jgi:hypothetical protein
MVRIVILMQENKASSGRRHRATAGARSNTSHTSTDTLDGRECAAIAAVGG